MMIIEKIRKLLLEQDFSKDQRKKLKKYIDELSAEISAITQRITDKDGNLDIKKLDSYYDYKNRVTFKKKINTVILSRNKEFKDNFKAEFRDFLASEYKDGLSIMQSYLSERTGQEFGGLPVSQAIKSEIIDSATIEGFTINEWIDKSFADISMTMRREVAKGIAQGINPNNLAMNLEGKGYKAAGGRIDLTVRSHYNNVLNIADEHAFNQAGVNKVRYSSVLDNRTSAICMSRSGNIYNIENKPNLPAHVACRSFYVPIITKEDEEGLEYSQYILDGRRSVEQLEDIKERLQQGYREKEISKEQLNKMLGYVGQAIKRK